MNFDQEGATLHLRRRGEIAAGKKTELFRADPSERATTPYDITAGGDLVLRNHSRYGTTGRSGWYGWAMNQLDGT